MADLLNKKTLIPAQSNIEQYLTSLQKTTLNLRVLGLQILLLTVLNLSGVLAMTSHIFQNQRGVLLTSTDILIGVIVLSAAFHDAMRRRGDVLFEEVSNELHWGGKESSDVTGSEAKHSDRPTLDARITLRSFAYASDLPLIPGKFGPGIYIVVNLFFLFLSWFLYSHPIS